MYFFTPIHWMKDCIGWRIGETLLSKISELLCFGSLARWKRDGCPVRSSISYRWLGHQFPGQLQFLEKYFFSQHEQVMAAILSFSGVHSFFFLLFSGFICFSTANGMLGRGKDFTFCSSYVKWRKNPFAEEIYYSYWVNFL